MPKKLTKTRTRRLLKPVGSALAAQLAIIKARGCFRCDGTKELCNVCGESSRACQCPEEVAYGRDETLQLLRSRFPGKPFVAYGPKWSFAIVFSTRWLFWNGRSGASVCCGTAGLFNCRVVCLRRSCLLRLLSRRRSLALWIARRLRRSARFRNCAISVTRWRNAWEMSPASALPDPREANARIHPYFWAGRKNTFLLCRPDAAAALVLAQWRDRVVGRTPLEITGPHAAARRGSFVCKVRRKRLE